MDEKLYSCYVAAAGFLEVYAHHLTAKRVKVVENMKGKTSAAASSTIHDDNSLYWDVISDPRHSWLWSSLYQATSEIIIIEGVILSCGSPREPNVACGLFLLQPPPLGFLMVGP